ncbi:unnamed protein product [marine sediment metagenome]|uniref:Uncharacterized protein n=1 Tax=marine sediment metagenome TaxID=412755 RepID=X1GZK6_9ZZZZ
MPFPEIYSGLTDWPWILLFDYNFLDVDDSKYDKDPIADDNFCIKLANTRIGMNVLIKFDPSLINYPT